MAPEKEGVNGQGKFCTIKIRGHLFPFFLEPAFSLVKEFFDLNPDSFPQPFVTQTCLLFPLPQGEDVHNQDGRSEEKKEPGEMPASGRAEKCDKKDNTSSHSRDVDRFLPELAVLDGLLSFHGSDERRMHFVFRQDDQRPYAHPYSDQ